MTYPWEDYIKDCGAEVVNINSVAAKITFEEKYQNNIITWTGYFADIRNPQVITVWGNEHAANVLVKMDPSESELFADIALSVPDSLYRNRKQDLFQALEKGEEVQFRAKFITHGTEFKMHHLHAIDINKTGRKTDLGEITVKEFALPTQMSAH